MIPDIINKISLLCKIDKISILNKRGTLYIISDILYRILYISYIILDIDISI